MPWLKFNISVAVVVAAICDSTQESLSLGPTNTKSTDQPVHLRRLISAFVIRFWNVSSKLATSEIQIFS